MTITAVNYDKKIPPEDFHVPAKHHRSTGIYRLNQAGLSLEQAPPISVPLRFFLSAPIFAVLAAILLGWQGPAMFASRWSAPLLAATHLITLGFLGLAMLGALLQMLPVIAGTPVRNPARVATLTHSLVVSGALLLVTGLALNNTLLIKIAMPLLGGGLGYFALVVMTSLSRAMPGNVTAIAMRLAVLALGITVVLGLVLASNHAWGWWGAVRTLFTSLHVAWGLLGWIGMLVVGVAFQVVPMLQLTPQYAGFFRTWLAIMVFCLLVMWSSALLLNNGSASLPQKSASILLAAAGSLFSIATLWLQYKRRRKLPDTTLSFWRFGMLSLLAAAALWIAGQIYPAFGAADRFSVLLGTLMLTGFAMSVVNGMLYKIVPFLVWFHLQSLRLGWRNVPNMREILPEQCTRPQMWLHFAAVPLLLAAVAGVPFIAYLAALAFGISNLWLWFNLLSAYRLFRRVALSSKPE